MRYQSIRSPQDVNLNRITRKVDRRLLPLLFFTYTLQFMDKLALSSSAVFGLLDDNHLTGPQYSWLNSVFYMGYMMSQPPVSYSIVRLPLARLLSFVVFLWGGILLASASTHSFHGQMWGRFLLGCTEAFVTPICMHYSLLFYTREQQPLRIAVWFAGNNLGGILSAFVAYGLGHISGPWKPWRYISLFQGTITALWSLVLANSLPNSPQDCTFLSADERQVFERDYEPFSDKGLLRDVLLYRKTWLFVALIVLNIIPNGGILSYGSLIIKGFGFTSLETALLNVPVSCVSWAAIVGMGFIASRVPNSWCTVVASSVILPIIGALIVWDNRSKWINFLGFMLLCVQTSTFPSVLALATSNYQASQRPLVNSVVLVFYCLANVIAPHLLDTDRSYNEAFVLWVVCFFSTILLAVTAHSHLKHELMNGQDYTL